VPLIECVPNISEGRRASVIESIAAELSHSAAALLDRSSDPSHNRTVFTLAGGPEQLKDTMLRLFACALDQIDLRDHTGVHPRIGAIDVIPFVPLDDCTMADCVNLARSTAAEISRRFSVPTYLYEEAATDPHRRNLADIRRGGLDGLAARMQQPSWQPDFGPDRPHPTAGVSAIGARRILIAYNVNLASDRLALAARIARTIRESSGGFVHVKAMGVRLEDRGIVQVSMNLTDYHQTSMSTVFDAVTREAATDGIDVLESEIVGLVPADALPPNAETRLKLRATDLDRILENRLARIL